MAKAAMEETLGQSALSPVVEPLPKSTKLSVESEEVSTTTSDEDVSLEDKQAITEVSKTITEEPESKIEPKRKMQSLAERGRIPNSFYVTLLVVGMLEGCSGMYSLDTLRSWCSSFATSLRTVRDLLQYNTDLMWSILSGDFREPKEYLTAGIVTILAGSIVWVLIGKPLSAGLWTGERSSKHKMHRYLGLFFLIQYGLAWVEFLTNYEGKGEFSFIPHTVALNGVVQGYTAYFSFKVLPQLKDPGYYSDKGVMSRDFLHENVCFNVFCVFGAVYYNNALREVLQSNIGGRIMEYTFVFYPFVLVRPWFPTTRMKDAGSRAKTRTVGAERFYAIGTTMIKIFYLWAKYFLGFQLNFMIFLGLMKPENMRFIQGLHLLNTGTVAIAMFLHTLRFKGILPAKFTFGFYIAQIYGTFTALPYALDTFMSHPKLTLLSLTGLLCNMTRSRAIHAAWCFSAMLILTFSDIDW